MGKKKPIKVKSKAKARIQAERKPPGAIVGLLNEHKKQKSQIETDKRVQDSLQKVIVELKLKLEKK